MKRKGKRILGTLLALVFAVGVTLVGGYFFDRYRETHLVTEPESLTVESDLGNKVYSFNDFMKWCSEKFTALNGTAEEVAKEEIEAEGGEYVAGSTGGWYSGGGGYSGGGSSYSGGGSSSGSSSGGNSGGNNEWAGWNYDPDTDTYTIDIGEPVIDYRNWCSSCQRYYDGPCPLHN